MASGATLSRAHSAYPAPDRLELELELKLKGGQMGPVDLFGRLVHGD